VAKYAGAYARAGNNAEKKRVRDAVIDSVKAKRGRFLRDDKGVLRELSEKEQLHTKIRSSFSRK
jgi:hypothetical protein